MTKDEQIHRIVSRLADVVACDRCGTRLRFGDVECPHCGADVEEPLRRFAESLAQDIS